MNSLLKWKNEDLKQNQDDHNENVYEKLNGKKYKGQEII